jgi:CHAT domain-containing protein
MTCHLARRARAGGLVLTCALACESGPRRDARTVRQDTVAARISTLLAQADSIYIESSDSAASLWQAARGLAESTHDSVSMARALTGLGQAARLRLDLEQARALGEAALAIKLKLGLRNELSRSYNTLGLVAWKDGRLRDALELLRQAQTTAAAVADSSGIGKATINTGLVQIDLGELTGARQSLLRGKSMAEAVKDSVNMARALLNLAAIDNDIGDPLSALATIEPARIVFRATRDTLSEVNALGQIALAYDALGEPQRAFTALDSAIDKAKRTGLRTELAEDLKILGDFFESAGDHRRALAYYAQATAATDSVGMPDERGNLLRNQARSQAALGRRDLAATFAGKALQLHEAGGFVASQLRDLVFLADLATSEGRSADASRALASARQVASSLGDEYARSQVVLAEARLAERAAEAAGVLRLLASLRTDLVGAGASTVAEASALRMRAYGKLGQLEAAAAAGRQAIAAFERVRGNYGSGELRTSFTSDRAGIYADLVVVLLRLGRVPEAFAVADGARGRALLEHISTARAEIRSSGGAASTLLEADSLLRAIDGLVSQLRERERTPLRERGTVYLALTRELADRITDARTRYETLVARNPQTSDAMVLLGGSARTASDVQASLAPNEALIEYFVTPARLIAFVIRKTGVSIVSTAVTSEEILDRTRLARDLMSRSRSTDADLPVMKGLYDLLVRPVVATGALRDARRLIIVRHSALTYLPFAALVDPATGRRLVEQFPLLYAPSAATLPTLRSARLTRVARGHAGAVALAPLPDELPASRREVLAIASAFPGTRPVIGPAATERELRRSLDESGVIHVATHGYMNARNPLFSRIELAPSSSSSTRDNGRLETHELLGMSITSRLVFLSGCETGVGEAWSTPFDMGEDYTTLARSFLFAGARNVIASLWRIDDEGAAELARRFYEGLRTLPAADALARAQVQMLSTGQWRNPYFWAAFEVVGDGT